MIEPQAYPEHQSFVASRDWLYFQHLLSRLIAFNLNIAPSMKVKERWSNVAAYAKSKASCNLGLWCDLWLGSLFCSIWSFIDLRSQSWGLGKIRHWKVPKKTNNGYCVSGFNRLPGQRSSLSTKTFDQAEEFKENPAPKKCPAVFCSQLVKDGHPRWISPPLDSLGVKSKECQEMPSSFMIVTTSSQLFFNKNRKTSLNNDDPKKSLRNQQVGESHGGPAITLFRKHGYSNPLRTLLPQLVIRTAFEQKILARIFGQSWTASWDFTRQKPPRKRWCR